MVRQKLQPNCASSLHVSVSAACKNCAKHGKGPKFRAPKVSVVKILTPSGEYSQYNFEDDANFK